MKHLFIVTVPTDSCHDRISYEIVFVAQFYLKALYIL